LYRHHVSECKNIELYRHHVSECKNIEFYRNYVSKRNVMVSTKTLSQKSLRLIWKDTEHNHLTALRKECSSANGHS